MVQTSVVGFFTNLEGSLLQSQYIFSLLLFVVKNRELFRSNSDLHDTNTRHNCDTFNHSKFNGISKGSFFILELEFLTNFHQLSEIYHMM